MELIKKVKKHKWVRFLFILSLTLLTMLALWFAKNNTEYLETRWRVKSILINDAEVITKYKKPSIVFHPNSSIELPKHISYREKFPITNGKWHYIGHIFSPSKVVIDDLNQTTFSGTYKVSMIRGEVKLLKLESENIIFYLERYPRFSVVNTTING